MRQKTHKKIVSDISRTLPRRVSLAPRPALRIPLTHTVRILSVVTILFAAFAVGPVYAPVGSVSTIAAAQQTETDDASRVTSPQEQRSELESQLTDLEKQIAEHQSTIERYQKQGKTLNNEIAGLNIKISKLNLQIKAVNVNITKLDREIGETQKNINRTENKIDYHKEALGTALRSLREADSQSLAAILIANETISDFFGKVNDIALVQQTVRGSLDEVVKLRQDLVEQKQELSEERQDTENLRAIQESQKRSVQTTQKEKDALLKETKGKESEYQKILKKTQNAAAQIRNRIFELLGGGELTFEKAYEYAKLAERATGVRAAIVLAILHRESLLGKNTGRCFYNDIRPGNTTAMNPKDIPYFTELLARLGIDPRSLVAKISCPNRDGTYGGAMGPAQFIPSTWKLYEPKITSVTGNNPPNPWNNSDAFAATALYLKDFGASERTTASEKKAAAIYYCGGRWQRSACSTYAARVMESATQFQRDIDVIQ